ncbi:ERI1 exoribonuclease 2-like [Drosophila subobscura]|uniref:ERI1 exoribonuclease 2-like n=1 Tax=Drosophila subobscura TaxID=7241 RepID=UPI00155AC189|nr:ERI1 exoribonuclease 2-like [Drosophila subobscura]XP_034653375.1 ERI1 exoribonuclease 2-like [Drosophila subobscura]
MHGYTHAIAVDFEATCFKDQPVPELRDSEIIEFPAVLVDLKTGKVEAEFHTYVKPVERPQLSEYCTNLTGIRQRTVDAAVTVQTAINRFTEWLEKELKVRNLVLPKMSETNPKGNCILVTWTNWDFNICLVKECERKKMRKPSYFDQWMNAKAIYRTFYKFYPYNFEKALSRLRLTFRGRAHSGIADARNLATLLVRMYRDGAPLAVTTDLSPELKLNENGGF